MPAHGGEPLLSSLLGAEQGSAAWQTLFRREASFPNWTQTPIPNFSLSAAGLITLADLSTVSERTAIVGGSSWLDSLLLAPGLHYQQAADALGVDDPSTTFSAVEQLQDQTARHSIVNLATVRYLRRVCSSERQGGRIVVQVGPEPELPSRLGWKRRRRRRGQGRAWDNGGLDLGLLSQALYLVAPLLTITALVFMILLQECQ